MIDWTTIEIATGFTLAITIAGVVAGILYTRRAAKRRKVLFWTFAQSNVVEGLGGTVPGLERLKLTYGSTEIPAASVSRLILWNEGTQAISSESLGTEGLKISMAEGVKLLDVRLVHATGGANGVMVDPSGSIRFNFVNPTAGFVIQVIHSGNPRQGVGLKGTLQDVIGPIYVNPARWFMRHLGPLFVGMVAALLIVVFYEPFPKGSDAAQLYGLGLLLSAILVPLVVMRVWPSVFWRPPGSLRDYAPPPIPVPRRR